MKNSKTRTLCEAAIFIAMAEILSLIKLYEFPNGGSVTLGDAADHPVRRAARLRLGLARAGSRIRHRSTYLIGSKFSIDWTTIICDYFLAFTALGFGAGLLARRRWSVFYRHRHRRPAALSGPLYRRRRSCGASTCPTSSSA